jgi:hypothetical protein
VDARRLRGQDWLTTLFGALLLGSLFLDWYAPLRVPIGAEDVTLTAWEAFAVTDVVLAIAALMGIGVGVLTLVARTTSVPIVWTTFGSIVTGVAAIWLTARTLFPPGDDVPRDLGAAVAPALAWLLAISCWSAMRNDRPGPAPRRDPQIERLPAPPTATPG